MSDAITMYKAVRVDMTSHYDGKTRWEVGVPVRVENPDPPMEDGCGRGIHVSRTLLGAVKFQVGPSAYLSVEVQPEHIIQETTKVRVSECLPLKVLTEEEQDAISEMRLWEANHPVNPLISRVTNPGLPREDLLWLLADWATVRESIRNSIENSAAASIWGTVWDAVQRSMPRDLHSTWKSVAAITTQKVWLPMPQSMRAPLYYGHLLNVINAYTASLFPNVHSWYGTNRSSPWASLRTLWLSGYLPSFDGHTWRLHRGLNARTVLKITDAELKSKS